MLVWQDRVSELHKSKTELEAQTDVARSAANQALRDKERAVHEKGIQEQKAAFLEAEVSRTSAALQQERRSHAAEVRWENPRPKQPIVCVRFMRGSSCAMLRGGLGYRAGDPMSWTAERSAQPFADCRTGLQLRELTVRLHDAEATAAEKEAAASRAAERAEAQEAAAADLLQQLRRTKQDAAEIREALERELETTNRLVRWPRRLHW